MYYTVLGIVLVTSSALCLATGLVAWLNCRGYQRRMREAQHEALDASARSYENYRRMQSALQCVSDFKALLASKDSVYRLREQVTANANANREIMLLTEIGTDALKLARAGVIIDAWKTYALGYEVFCEALSDKELAGSENAQIAIKAARDTLRLLGEYDE